MDRRCDCTWTVSLSKSLLVLETDEMSALPLLRGGFFLGLIGNKLLMMHKRETKLVKIYEMNLCQYRRI